MIHDTAKLSGDDWNRIESTKDGVVLYFNEPERAGVSAEQAADAWFKQVTPLRKENGNKLVSPSCASDSTGQAWIADFMTRVESDPPDFLGVHYYGTDIKEAIKYLEEAHAKFPNQPLFISEIASISRNYQEVLAFTAEAANWMDETEWVEEYVLFEVFLLYPEFPPVAKHISRPICFRDVSEDSNLHHKQAMLTPKPRRYGFFGCMRKVADGFVSPEAQLMKSNGQFTDLMYKLMYDQPMKA